MFRLAVLTVSTSGSQGQREDTSGQVIQDILAPPDYEVARYEVVPDDRETIANKLAEGADAPDVDLIISTGGTGRGPQPSSAGENSSATPMAKVGIISKENADEYE